jgi:hypothetical protein
VAAAEQAVLEIKADLGAAIETEQPRGQVAEIALAQGAQEPVRQPEVHLALRHPQVGGQRGHVKVRLRVVGVAVGVVVLRGCLRCHGRHQ